MKSINYYGDDRLKHRIVYNKNSYSACIYCGRTADTREHIPSKVFLNKPFPENLSIVPACFDCNNSFSKDELFLLLFIELMKQHLYGTDYTITEEIKSKIVKNENVVKDINKAIIENSLEQFEKRISRVLHKLAIGHSVYELSDGFYLEGKPTDNVRIEYSFLHDMSNDEVEDFTLPYNLNGEILPEVGSRVFERIMVIELGIKSIDDPKVNLEVV